MNWLILAMACIRALGDSIEGPAPNQIPLGGQFGNGWNVAQLDGFSTLGNAVRTSDHIAVWQIADRDDRQRYANFTVVRSLKGATPPGTLSLGHSDGASPLRHELNWMQPGRLVVAFIKDDSVAVCYGPHWQIFALRNHRTLAPCRHSRDFNLSALYWGSVDDLIGHVQNILAGDEVIVTAKKTSGGLQDLFDGLPLNSAPLWRLKASLRITKRAQTIRAANYVGWGAASECGRPAIVRRLVHPDPCIRSLAIDELESLGPAARGALPELWRRFTDREPRLRLRAAEAALRLDPENATPLLAIVFELQHGTPAVRDEAVGALNNHRERAQEFLPQVFAVVEQERPESRSSAVQLLGELGRQAAPDVKRAIARCIAWQIQRSDQTEMWFRRSAVEALLALGPDIEPAFPILKRVVLHDSRHPALVAAAALINFDAGGPAFVGHLLELPSINAERKLSLVRVLANAGPCAVPAIPGLRACLMDENQHIVFEAAELLLRIEEDLDERARTALQAFAQAPNNLQVFRMAFADNIDEPLRLLRAASGSSREGRRVICACLMKTIRQADSPQRDRALARLREYGAEARAHAPELWRLLKSADREFRVRLIAALWQIDCPTESGSLQRDPRQQLLLEIRRDLRKPQEEEGILRRLGRLPGIEEVGITLVPELRALCRVRNPQVVHNALNLLRRIGPAARDALPELLRLVDRDDSSIQQMAILALCRVGRGHPVGVERLREWCETESLDILCSIEPRDLGRANITPLLLLAIRSWNDNLADHARELLRATDPEAACREEGERQTGPPSITVRHAPPFQIERLR